MAETCKGTWWCILAKSHSDAVHAVDVFVKRPTWKDMWKTSMIETPLRKNWYPNLKDRKRNCNTRNVQIKKNHRKSPFSLKVMINKGRSKGVECKVCGKIFAKDLKRHMLTHTGERPFQCSYCPNVPRFRLKAHLKSHLRTQHGFEATPEELEASKNLQLLPQ